MIANFFQSLSAHGVEYLLISGQATVLYGAATFSEDIDLWVNPTTANRDKFLTALHSSGARYYKLTPPFNVQFLSRGHGFHFLLPDGKNGEIFLDVMGVPPRVGSFSSALVGGRWIETEWGKLHTIGLKDLVELKKTQRLEDYSIISNLALAWFEQPESTRTPADFNWALANIFTLSALHRFFTEHPSAVETVAGENTSDFQTFGRHVSTGRDVPEAMEERLACWMQSRMTVLQQADRRYWRDIITELKQLRAEGKLMPEDAEV